MTANNSKTNLTVISAVGILLLVLYFADSIFGTRDIASSTGNMDRAKERKSARSEIAANYESSSPSINEAKNLVLNEWGSDSTDGYKKFMERVEKIYPTPDVDPVLNEFE